MSFFKVDLGKLVKTSLPVWARTEPRLTQLNAFVSPVVYLYGLFTANRDKNLYYLNHNGQVCYLIAALNDAFDPDLRRIFYNEAYILPSPLLHAYVNVPSTVVFNANQMAAIIASYRVPGRLPLEVRTF